MESQNGEKEPCESGDVIVKPGPCDSCGAKGGLKCSRCKLGSYCNQECQRRGWKSHKDKCLTPLEKSLKLLVLDYYRTTYLALGRRWLDPVKVGYDPAAFRKKNGIPVEAKVSDKADHLLVKLAKAVGPIASLENLTLSLTRYIPQTLLMSPTVFMELGARLVTEGKMGILICAYVFS